MTLYDVNFVQYKMTSEHLLSANLTTREYVFVLPQTQKINPAKLTAFTVHTLVKWVCATVINTFSQPVDANSHAHDTQFSQFAEIKRLLAITQTLDIAILDGSLGSIFVLLFSSLAPPPPPPGCTH